ncbi:macrophage mannose receptor 1-like isoform X6, partial [Clarias magur]
MKLYTFLLITGLTGFLSVPVSMLQTVPHKYELIKKSMSWPAAQNYCRVMYNDLATMLSDSDWQIFNKEAAVGLTTFAWVGLYSDTSTWHWSLDDLPLNSGTYTNWYPGGPYNYYQNDICAIIGQNYNWFEQLCTFTRPFICYNAFSSDVNKFIGISNPQLPWLDARAYCRTHYTDLASSLNSSDQNMLAQIQHMQGDSWIGLHRQMNSWKWSDGTKASNIPWSLGQPVNIYGSENCAVVYNGHFYVEQCNILLYFFCH